MGTHDLAGTDDFEHGHVPPPVIDHRAAPHDAPHDIFFAAVKTTRMPMIVTDPRQPDNPIIFANRRLPGDDGLHAEDEIVGRNCRFLQGPETDRETIDADPRGDRRASANSPPRS